MYAYGYIPQEQHPLGDTTNEGAMGGHEDQHGEPEEVTQSGQQEAPGLEYPPLSSPRATDAPPHENGTSDKTVSSQEGAIVSRKEAEEHA